MRSLSALSYAGFARCALRLRSFRELAKGCAAHTRLAPVVALAACFASSAPAFAGNPWEELMGPQKGATWSDPDARFSLELPVGWEAPGPRKNAAHVVDFWKTHPDYGHRAHVTVEMRNLPPKVKLAHLAERVFDEVKTVARDIRMQSEDRLTISGVPAHRRHFIYQQLGHAQLVAEVVQIILLVGERAFIVTLETAAGAREIFWEDFERMMKNFNGHGPGDEMGPAPGGKRKKLRAGEMVNPDGLQY